jgi:hypothetical protein
VNYILMQLVLVALSWCTFFIHPDALDARLGIALTLLLAINVFQASKSPPLVFLCQIV